MANIVTYANQILDTLGVRAFCSVDSLILSWLSYMILPEEYADARSWDKGIRFIDLYHAEHFPVLFRETWDPENSLLLLTAMAASPRYRNMRIIGFTEKSDEVKEEQFAAMTFQIPGEMNYVAFRGTDMSLVGWKEDFNMTFQYPIPAQAEALRYLETAAEHCEGDLLVGGHSKGGNLAVYAAANAGPELRQRIRKVYSHDGPGFMEGVWKKEEFRSLVPILEKTLPQSSLVGLLMDHEENLSIVRSNVLVNTIWQHNPFTWQVENGDFCYMERLTRRAEYMNRTLDGWISEMSDQDREQFFDTMFSLLELDGTKTLTDFREDWYKKIPAALKTVSEMNAEKRNLLLGTVKELAAMGVKYLPELFRPGKAPESAEAGGQHELL